MNEPNPWKSLLITAVLFLVHLVALGGVVAMLVRYVPPYERLFMDFGVKLPAMTVAVIQVSRMTIRYWYLLPMLGIADLGLLAMLSRQDENRRWLANTWTILVLLAAVLLVGVIFFAVTEPFLGLMTNLSK